ncbi:MAG: helix-turn-helix domain-containing protein [Candidatus Sulfotelmatobacter sp.]
MPRQPDPALEQRILEAASRLWARGGEKALTMRAVAKAAGTTTPTVYERYRDRDDILRALRLQTRREMFDALSRTRTLREAVQCKLQFALDHRHAYQMLMDGVAKPPSLHEPWPSFNLMRERLAAHLGGTPRQHTRLTLAVWSLTYGTAMIIIRGQFQGELRTQTLHACLDAVDAVLECARSKHFAPTGPQWPPNLILGEGRQSRLGNGKDNRRGTRMSKPR